MAKRKGKSRRRVKDWNQQYRRHDDAADHAATRGKTSRRGVKLPPSRLDAPEEDLEHLPKAEGLVVNVSRRGAYVRVEGHDEELFCAIAKTFRAPENATLLTVGDAVTVALTTGQTEGRTEIDRERMDGFIVTRAPRETLLSRPQPMSGKRRDEYSDETFEKVIAANMDILLIVASTRQPPLRHGLIDRFLIIAERGEMTPVLVINKIDLGRPDERVLGGFVELGVEILMVSAETNEGLAELRRRLAGSRSVLAGASGVGKSTLINAMIPEADAATNTVRQKDQRGRHTTTSALIYDLPEGGMVVDTPGIRELGMAIPPRELPWFFPEFEEIAQQCKFNDCTHTHEPQCAVQAAVASGEISPRRYESYLRILDTLEE
ncbi:MAG: ribosome small subunit-dependent GTPase A [Phycisphaerae bacterium]